MDYHALRASQSVKNLFLFFKKKEKKKKIKFQNLYKILALIKVNKISNLSIVDYYSTSKKSFLKK